MLILGQDIINKELLVNADEENLCNATYNLTIAKIIYANRIIPDNDGDHITLGPGEIAIVVFKELFKMGNEKNCTALVCLKSGITKRGILALDTGFVDPTYTGPIGTMLVNFSKDDCPIYIGAQIFRVIFMEHTNVTDNIYIPNNTYDLSRPDEAIDKYVQDRNNELTGNYTATFLNLDVVAQDLVPKVTNKVMDGFITALLKKFKFWLFVIPVILILAFGVKSYVDLTATKAAEWLTSDQNPGKDEFMERLAKQISNIIDADKQE